MALYKVTNKVSIVHGTASSFLLPVSELFQHLTLTVTFA
jgi:hypothetical protein